MIKTMPLPHTHRPKGPKFHDSCVSSINEPVWLYLPRLAPRNPHAWLKSNGPLFVWVWKGFLLWGCRDWVLCKLQLRVAKREGEGRAISTLLNSESHRQHTLSTTQLAAGFTRSPEGRGGLPLPLPSQNLRPLSSSQVRSRTHARPELPQFPDPFPVKSLPEVSVKKSDCYCTTRVKTETFLSKPSPHSEETVINAWCGVV